MSLAGQSFPHLADFRKPLWRAQQGDRVKKLPCDQLCEEVVIPSGGLALEPH